MITLSIIVPVYNEKNTVKKTLNRLMKTKIDKVKKEIVVINDGSSDGTDIILKEIVKINKAITLIHHSKNQGKGAAIRTGMKKAKGDFVVIQDADLEYDPAYLNLLVKPVTDGKAKVVYGTRLKRLPNFREDEKNPRFLLHYLGNRFLSLLISVLFVRWLTDIETGYKIFPRKIFAELNIQSFGFEFEPEITIKLIKKGFKIIEIPIKTTPRGYNEGKKLNTVSDGMKALRTIIKYRFQN